MSAYLSPIQSSGDSTPIESLIGSQSCIPLVKDERDQIESEFAVRGFKQTPNRRQTSKMIDSDRQKAPTTTNKRPRLVDGDNSTTTTTTATTAAAAATTSEEEELEDSSGDANEDELRGDQPRFMPSQQQIYSKRHKMGRNQPRSTQNSDGSSTKSSNQNDQHNYLHNQKPHQCLADQFLSMISIASKSDNHQNIETRSSSCVSSESEPLNDCDSNAFYHHDHDHKLRGLFTRAASRQQKLRKRFKQILQSIPVVQLVATTSIMTITILLSLLLLGDSRHFVTALRSHRTAAPAPTAGELDGLQNDELRRELGLETKTSGGNINQGQLEALPQMQSFVMGSRIERPDADQRNTLAQASELMLADENVKLAAMPTHQQHQPVNNLRHELIGKLFTQRQHQRHHNSRHHQHYNSHQRQPAEPEHGHASEKRQFEGRLASGDQMRELNLASEPQQQVGLLDSLGAILFGAANRQQPQRASDESGRLSTRENIDDDRATLERDSIDGGNPDEGSQTSDFVLDGAPHVSPVMTVSPRPVHLRSSVLVLNSQNPSQQSTQHSPARQTGSHPRQQHVGTGPQQQQQQQQQQHQQQQQPATESTMASNRHERKFDVPQIQCNNTDEGFERFACPTPDNLGRYRCIEDVLFCDGYYDCPNGEDESRTSCMYYRLFISHIDILTNTFLTWVKSQTRQAANDINSNQNVNNPQHHRSPLVGNEFED